METIEIVRVKFRWPGKIVEFVNRNNLSLSRDSQVVVETQNGGTKVGTVAIPPRIRLKRQDDDHLTSVIRVATEQDMTFESVKDDFKMDVKNFFATRVQSRQLTAVKMIDLEKADAGRKLIIYYSCENKKFDPREFAKELGQRFNSRIDLRQVGLRDAARLAGGIGKCGLSLCCATWLPDFEQISIKMAKDQGLSLDPDGISGQCGRLLCCLGYEHQNYVALGKGLPKVGKIVLTPGGEGRVVKLDILKFLVTVRFEDGSYETYKGAEVKRKFGPGSSAQSQEDADDDAEDSTTGDSDRS